MALTVFGYPVSFAFILYLTVSACIGMVTVNFLYKSNRFMSAMISLVLLLLVFIFFAFRWFTAFQLKGTPQAAAAAAAASAANQCNNGNVQSETRSSWPPIVNACPDFMLMNGKNCYDANGLYTTDGFPPSTEMPLSTLSKTSVCNTVTRTDTPYMRWEGVYDGIQCTPGNLS